MDKWSEIAAKLPDDEQRYVEEVTQKYERLAAFGHLFEHALGYCLLGASSWGYQSDKAAGEAEPIDMEEVKAEKIPLMTMQLESLKTRAVARESALAENEVVPLCEAIDTIIENIQAFQKEQSSGRSVQ